MKDARRMASEALFSALVGALLLVILAIVGINPDEILDVVRQSAWPDRGLLLALLLAVVISVIGVRRLMVARRQPDVVQPTPGELHLAALRERASRDERVPAQRQAVPSGDVPKMARGHVEVGDFIPGLATVEHAGLTWTTTMPGVSDVEIINGHLASRADEIDVKFPPVCPRCRTDLEERQSEGATLDALVSGGGREAVCIACGWTHPLTSPMHSLRRQAATIARGICRRLEDR